jgi:hypothetical protein
MLALRGAFRFYGSPDPARANAEQGHHPLWPRSPGPSGAAKPDRRIAATISSSVKSGCWATRASSAFACSSNGDLLPPVGFALALPVSRHRCNHFTAELGHRLKLSAASRRDAPASTASITRSRKSSEYGFGIARTPQRTNQCSQTRPPTRSWESLRFSSAGKCSSIRAIDQFRKTLPSRAFWIH